MASFWSVKPSVNLAQIGRLFMWKMDSNSENSGTSITWLFTSDDKQRASLFNIISVKHVGAVVQVLWFL